MSSASGRKGRRSRHGGTVRVLWIAIAVAWAIALSSAPGALGAAPHAGAYAARTVSGTDTGHLYLVRASGSRLLEEGSASGGLAGHVRATLEIGATFTGSFTIYARHGTIRGHGSAGLHGSGRYQSFAGTLVVSGGSGRYAHARARAGLYGTFDRRTFAVVVQTTGRITY